MAFIDGNKKVGEAKVWNTELEMVQDAKIKKLLKCVDFYADKEHWRGNCILDDVVDCANSPHGGYRARQCRKEIGG